MVKSYDFRWSQGHESEADTPTPLSDHYFIDSGAKWCHQQHGSAHIQDHLASFITRSGARQRRQDGQASSEGDSFGESLTFPFVSHARLKMGCYAIWCRHGGSCPPQDEPLLLSLSTERLPVRSWFLFFCTNSCVKRMEAPVLASCSAFRLLICKTTGQKQLLWALSDSCPLPCSLQGTL